MSRMLYAGITHLLNTATWQSDAAGPGRPSTGGRLPPIPLSRQCYWPRNA
jgi:hypothetical protein